MGPLVRGLSPPNTRRVRALAWVALAVGTGWLVRGEAPRPDLPSGVQTTLRVVYRTTEGRQVRLDLYSPAGPVPQGGRPALLAIHGGGWRGGSRADYGRSVAELATHGIVVVAIDYQLSRPGRPSWPDNLEDVQHALQWVRERASELGIDRERIAVMGASAGGHLALMLGLTAPAREVSAVIDFYGPTDLSLLARKGSAAESPVLLMLGGRPDEMPGRYTKASPIARIGVDAPPVLVFHGHDDALVPLAQSQILAEGLHKLGVVCKLDVVEGARHGFGLRTGDRVLIPDILTFLQEVWGHRGSGTTRAVSLSTADRP
jgi:acetyl esterase/lipase